jgi:hypothetical protein
MALNIALKCRLRVDAQVQKGSSRDKLAGLLGASPEACCCC